MLALSTDPLALRQALGRGRLSERITNRGFDDFDATMRFSHVGGSGSLPVRLLRKPGGYFALQLAPDREMPDFSDIDTVTLTVRFEIPGNPPIDVPRTLAGAALALVERTLSVGGQSVTASAISGAPFDFSHVLAPKPVALAGTVLRNNDPAEPVAGATVTASPAPPASTDALGRFRIPALPVLETLTLSVDDAGNVTEAPFRPDFTKPENLLTLSLQLVSS